MIIDILTSPSLSDSVLQAETGVSTGAKRHELGQFSTANVNRALPINFCGGPDEIVAQLKQAREQIGCGVVDLSFQTPGSEHPDQLMEALELFGKEVLPHIREV